MLGKTSDPPHYADFNNWEVIPESEIERLATNLGNHLKKMGIKKSKKERIAHVKIVLQRQNNTCKLSDCNGKYCWNEPKENWKNGQQSNLPYLKLQWGHIKPRCRGGTVCDIDDLCLMCGRCNNQIQTSRNLIQLPVELILKSLKIIEMIGKDEVVKQLVFSEGEDNASEISDRLVDLASSLCFEE